MFCNEELIVYVTVFISIISLLVHTNVRNYVCKGEHIVYRVDGIRTLVTLSNMYLMQFDL